VDAVGDPPLLVMMAVEAQLALRGILARAVDARVAPGVAVEVGTVDGPSVTEAVGRLSYAIDAPAVTDDTIYDLASLTKVIATTTVSMRLAAAGALPLDTVVVRRIAEFTGEGRDQVTVADLLGHSAGLPVHRPYFRRVAGRRAYRARIAAEPLAYPPNTRHEYTDLGFMLLGLLLEDAAGQSLSGQFDAWRDEAIPGAALCYGVPAEYRPRTAPTEAETWRGRVLVGDVHDANAAALGGVAGHAGLFGTAAAVGAFARWYLELWLGRRDASAGVPSRLAAQFARRGTVPGSSRALGWDTMLPTSSCGTRLSPSAIGHTGFTGTSLWIDPTRRLYIVLLCNRVHPHSSAADGIRDLRIAVHDAIAEGWPA
jgi:CubicO group peptidase (beta-lactamase class C family)